MPLSRKDALKLQSKMVTPDVDEPLVAPESGAIALDRPSLEGYLEVEFVRPKGVETLRAWGNMTLTAGKHKTFAEAFEEDLVYAVVMSRKQSLTTNWAISYKNYALARLQAAARAEQMADQRRQRKDTRRTPPTRRSQSQDLVFFEGEDGIEEWKFSGERAQHATPVHPTGSSAPTAEPNKGKRAPIEDPPPAMNTDLTAEQRLDILTKKALLQRELAKLEQLEADSWDEEKIDACIFQIEEKLGKLHSENGDFRNKMHYKLRRLDVLEVTLADSGISNAIRNRQGRAVSIKTVEAKRIWFMIHTYEVMHGTLCAVHCPSEVMGLGKMSGNTFLNKKSFIYTTSRAVHEATDTRRAKRHLSNPGQLTSNTPAPRSQTWQLRLAEQAAAAMISDCSVPVYLSELLVADLKRDGDLNLSNQAALENAQQVVKRRRLLRKQPAPEATLFHQATASGRTMEDQYDTLTDSWTKWAGPCQLLYIVAAGESHWQAVALVASAAGGTGSAVPPLDEGYGVGEIRGDDGDPTTVPPDSGPEAAEQPEQPETEVSPAISMEQEPEEPMELDPVEVPVPDEDEDILFGDSECFLIHPSSEQVWEIGLHETGVEYENLPSPEQALQYVLVASTEKKKRTEVKLRDLSQHERQLFKEAQNKEIKAWLDHRTVRRVAAGTLEDSQLMRKRWSPADSPTGKGDGRKLGIKPPEELREALKMGPTDQCRLEGGAYGRIDAPFLWFQTLKQTLEELGFIQNPFDACTFSLVTKGPDGEPRVHGVLGIHVDDGIGGGDSYFGRIIEQLRGIYNFGSYDEREFVLTGILFRQWDDGSIEMDQMAYIEKISPIHVPRDRRLRSEDPLSASEVHELRRLNGSLQYAAVHTRPDIAAKVGFLQSMVTKGRVKHLLEANKV
ncbi:TY5A [Symbiodinium microadriaticum]|nr:TY5A [Symbiodinium microadriaticum]